MPQSTIHWNQNADGDWATKADWTPHRLPTSTDDVSIDTASLHTVTHSTGADTVNTLTVGNDDFVVSGGSLAINSTSRFANLLAVSGGTLAFGGNATAASFTQSGGTVSGSNTLTVTGAANFTSFSMLETGPGTTLLKGVSRVPFRGALSLDGGRVLENQGTLNLLGEIDLGLNPFGGAQGGGTLKNDAGGTVVMRQSSFFRPGAGAIGFFNAGTLELMAGFGGAVIGVDLTNTGSILARSGELDVDGFTNSGPGTVSISSGANFALFRGGSASASAFTVAAGGTLDFFPGNFRPGLFSLAAGTISGAGTVAVDGGELALGAGAVTVANFTQGINSTVSGSGTLTITGNAGFIVCLQTGPGTTLFTASSRFGLGDGFHIDGGRVVENQGGIGSLTGHIVIGANPFGPSLGGGTLKNDAGAFLSTRGDLRVVDGVGVNSFINAGTFEKFFQPPPEGGPDFTVGVIGVNFTDTGVIKIDGGTLEFRGAVNSFSGAILGPGKGAILPVKLSFAGGTSALNSGTVVAVPEWSLSGGAVVNLNESLQFSGAFSQTDIGTTLNVATGDTLTLKGAATLTGTVGGAGTVKLSTATIADLTVTGTATLSDVGVIDQAGIVTLGGAGGGAVTLTIGTGAIYGIDDNWDIARGASLGSSIDNGGLLIKSGGTGTSVVGVRIADTGSIEAASGTLDLTQAITGGGTLRVDAGATLEVGFSAGATLGMSFNGGNATLALGNPSKFAATIRGFAATDTIELLARKATAATLEAGDMLVITNGSKTVATLQLAGNFAGDIFHVTSDGAGGTKVTVTTTGAAGGSPNGAAALPPDPASGFSHRFIAAMAGVGAGGGGPVDAMSHGRPDAWRPTLAVAHMHFA